MTIIYIVCPKRILKYFTHLIDSFSHELKEFFLHIKVNIVTDVDKIFDLQNSLIILFGLQEFQKFPNVPQFFSKNKIIVYNTEQLQSKQWDFMINHTYPFILEWWDYSQNNIDYIQIHYPSIWTRYVTFGYSKAIDLCLNEGDVLNINRKTLSFFGTDHERRFNICMDLNMALEPFKKNVKYITSDILYGQAYNQYISTNSIFLNIHYYTPSILEVVRIVPLISQGHLVISERSDDTTLDRLLDPFIVWLDPTRLKEKAYIEELVAKINNHNPFKLKDMVIQNLAFRDFLEHSGAFETIAKLSK